MDYRVRLEIYKGPLDLLLYLIRESELDIYDIPIATITEQYIRHLELMKLLDPNVAGDFLVMASTLMEIKSRMLLPRPEKEEGEEEEGDPRIELIRQLMEYKKFKEAAAALAEKREEQAERFGRAAKQTFDEVEPVEETVEISEVSVWDILSAFDRVMRQTLRLQPATITDRDLPVRHHIVRVLEMLRTLGTITFLQIFETCEDRIEATGAFLALLEMSRAKVIGLEQTADHTRITISLVGEENVEKLLSDVTESLRTIDEMKEDEAPTETPEEPASPGEAVEVAKPTSEERHLPDEDDEEQEEEEPDEELASIRGIEIHDVVLTEEPDAGEPDAGEEKEEHALSDDETAAELSNRDEPPGETDGEVRTTDEETT